MFKKFRKNEKGFTLAELLIVIAIIGVLVAISIPIFTTQLEKSREAVDLANLRAAYAEGSVEALTQADVATGWTKYYTSSGKLEATATNAVKGKATQTGWQSTDPALSWTSYEGKATNATDVIKVTYTPGTAGAEGAITVDFAAAS